MHLFKPRINLAITGFKMHSNGRRNLKNEVLTAFLSEDVE